MYRVQTPAPATVACYWPGRMSVEDVRSLGLATALAYEAVTRKGASMSAVRDSYGVLQLALSADGKVWSRAAGHSPAAVAGWGRAS